MSQRRKGHFEMDGFNFEDTRLKTKIQEVEFAEAEYFDKDEVLFLDEAEEAIEKWMQRESRRSRAAEQRAKKAWQ